MGDGWWDRQSRSPQNLHLQGSGRVCFAGEEEVGVISETVELHVEFLKDMAKEECWGRLGFLCWGGD